MRSMSAMVPEILFDSDGEPVENDEDPIIIFDTSVSYPYESNRRAKLVSLKEKAEQFKVMAAERNVFVNKRIVILAIWNDDLIVSDRHSKQASTFNTSEEQQFKDCFLVTKPELMKLNIKF
jgi:hypothetical protein